MSVTDELVSNAQSYEKSFDAGDLPLPPAKRVGDRCLHGRAPEPIRPARVA